MGMDILQVKDILFIITVITNNAREDLVVGYMNIGQFPVCDDIHGFMQTW